MIYVFTKCLGQATNFTTKPPANPLTNHPKLRRSAGAQWAERCLGQVLVAAAGKLHTQRVPDDKLQAKLENYNLQSGAACWTRMRAHARAGKLKQPPVRGRSIFDLTHHRPRLRRQSGVLNCNVAATQGSSGTR